MSGKVVVYKARTNTIIVKLGMDVSADAFTSEIRSEPDFDSTLIATWIVSFVGTGSDGQLKLVLDDAITKEIKANSGYMDLKRVIGGEPVAVFERPLEVTFQGTVTE